jgi:phage-related minor tail protein
MIRALTVTLFLVTPAGTALAWMAAGPLAALAVLLLLPSLAIGVTVARIRNTPEAATQDLASRRDRLKSQLDS